MRFPELPAHRDPFAWECHRRAVAGPHGLHLRRPAGKPVLSRDVLAAYV